MLERLIKINQEMSESYCKIAFSTVGNERSALTRVIDKPNFIKLIIHYSPIISRSIDKKIINRSDLKLSANKHKKFDVKLNFQEKKALPARLKICILEICHRKTGISANLITSKHFCRIYKCCDG